MRKIQLFLLVICYSTLSYSQSLYQKVDSIRRQHNLPEMGCAIVSSKNVIDITVTGYHRIDKQDVADSANINDHFHLGSNTKAITGFIAATLVQKEKLTWDTKFFDLYPQLKKGANPAYYNITLKQLLSHRAGIQPFTEGEKEKAPKTKGSKSEQRLAFAKYVLKQPPVHPNDKKTFPYSGKGYVYSNAGYAIASLMLEKAAGKSWEELVKELAQKIQINIGFGWPNLTDSMQPWGHQEVGDKLIPLPGNVAYNLNLLEPAGDINMSLPDYCKFIQLQLQGLKGNDIIIYGTTYNFLHFGIKDYSIGWLNGAFENGKRYSAHEGSAGTFHILTVVYPDDDIALIVCMNAAGENADKAKTDLYKYLTAKYAK